MVRKVQIPVVGGIRKVVTVKDVEAGTILAGYGGETLTIAQLRTLLGVAPITNTGNGNIGPPGQGTPPKVNPQIIQFMFGDDGGGGDSGSGPPGQQGAPGTNGASGSAGPAGPAVFLTAEPGEDGWGAIPGNPGVQGSNGANGTSGSAGPAGPAVMFFAEDGVEGGMGPPGPTGAAGSAGGGANPFNVTPFTHGTGVPSFVANDEFEGTVLDTTGTRFTGATPWATVNFTGVASTTLTDGQLLLSGDTSTGANENIILQAASAAGTWTIEAALIMHNGTVNAHNSSCGLMLKNNANGHLTKFGAFWNAGTWNYLVQQLTSPTSVSSNTLTTGIITSTTFLTNDSIPLFIQCVFDGTNLKYLISATGVPGTFVQIYTETAVSWLGATPTHVGLTVNTDTGISPTVLIVDHFRQVA